MLQMRECMLCKNNRRTVAAICHKSWGSRSTPPLSLCQSSFLPFPVLDSPGGLVRARPPAAKHFDAIYDTLKQPYKIHIMHYRNQRACRVQQLLSAELILWITGHGSKSGDPPKIGPPV